MRIEPEPWLVAGTGSAVDLGVEAAVVGTGVIHLFEDWLHPYLASGALAPVL